MGKSYKICVHIYNVALLLLIVTTIKAQNHLNDKCKLSNGKEGKCKLIDNCPNAIQIIRNKEKPDNCGFEGTRPIVCCELLSNSQNVGEISRQKCLEMFDKHIFVSSGGVSADHELSVNPKNRTKREEPQINLSNDSVIPLNEQQPSAVGGEDAYPLQFPHMAALGYGDENNILWMCGGSLISEKFVLTAAHCIRPIAGPVRFVRLGDLNLKQTTDDAKPQNFKIARVVVHSDYKAPSVYNDIALIELDKKAVINNYVQPACLQTETNISETKWSATGWGLTSFGGSPSDHLQNVGLRSYSFQDCQRVYASTSPRRLKNGLDIKTQICAGEQNKDTCQGDSGGPLQVQSGDTPWGHHIIIGVTSFGKGCGLGDSPAIYTRVSYYIKWIESIVWPS